MIYNQIRNYWKSNFEIDENIFGVGPGKIPE